MKKRILRKFVSVVFFISFFMTPVSSQVVNSMQVIQAGHWIYDALTALCNRAGEVSMAQNAPLTVAELKYVLDGIDVEKLDSSDIVLHEKISAFLDERESFFASKGFNAVVNPFVNPEFYYKSNPEIDWTFDYYLEDYALGLNVGTGVGDIFYADFTPVLGKNHYSVQKDSNFSNIITERNEFEAALTRKCFAALGYGDRDWGLNLTVGKEGLALGRSLTGSVIYNSTFETDFFAQLNAYTENFRFQLDTVQLNRNTFFYFHNIEVRLFDILKVAFLEGTLQNKEFELRYLNPFYMLHNFFTYDDFHGTDNYELYYRANTASYMGIQAEIVPVSGLRIYALYAQNELQGASELTNDFGRSFPDSIGLQIGAELTLPSLKSIGWWHGTVEGIYTSPFMYMKQHPDWSFGVNRTTDFIFFDHCYDVWSWTGSPFGPDCLGAFAGIEYTDYDRLSLGASYSFVAHGENSASTLSDPSNKKTVTKGDGTTESIYVYYPQVAWKWAETQEEKDAAIKRARDPNLTGTVEYTNRVQFDGSYRLNKSVSFTGRMSFSVAFNCGNKAGNTQFGVELGAGCKVKVF
ncbi:MAG: hypothetical protein MJ183_00355 [Treponemataceae bacterium]|nr:hypothetical protein [Treponemataceae bacterium]